MSIVELARFQIDVFDMIFQMNAQRRKMTYELLEWKKFFELLSSHVLTLETSQDMTILSFWP